MFYFREIFKIIKSAIITSAKSIKSINLRLLYLFLLPVFFVLHGYAENFGLITLRDCLLLLVIYFIATVIVYLLSYLLYRNHIKAGLLAALLMSYYFFFGAMHDFLKNHFLVLARYSFLLPFSLIVLIAVAIYLKKTTTAFYRLTFFLNMLLIIYLLVDTGSIVWKSTHPDPNRLAVYHLTENNNYRPCDTCSNPDIYFLLFDEYNSSASLKETYGYNNSDLDSFLLQQGFSFPVSSHSNYNFTSFSMASILNMQYIQRLRDPLACTIEDYAYCNNLVRNNEVIRFLSSRQYDIINYSVFDLAGNPSLVEQSFLPVKTKLITSQTFLNCLMRDIGWNLYMGKFEIKWFSKNRLYTNLNDNNKLMDLAIKETARQSSRPRFVYAHFEMPHPPFYYDKNFRPRDAKTVIDEGPGGTIPSYLGYLPYTNSKIKELINTIQQNTGGKAVIILMSDHGYRTLAPGAGNMHYFNNLNAVYFPGRRYTIGRESISGVNQFRVIFNTLFNQQLPLLKDSVIFLQDKAP